MRKPLRFALIATAIVGLAVIAGSVIAPGTTERAAAAKAQGERYNVAVKDAAAFKAARQPIEKAGGKIVYAMPEINVLTVTSTNANFKADTAKLKGVQSVSKDSIRKLVQPQMKEELFGKNDGKKVIANNGKAPVNKSPIDKLYPGLAWNLQRIGATMDGAWAITKGDKAVTIAVEDTGVDFTHVELAPNFDASKSIYFHDPACLQATGYDDQRIVDEVYGGNAPVEDDFNGHGSWIAGNVAAAMKQGVVNGIAPNINLAMIKISDWCGSAYLSTISNGFIFAANHGIDVVTISFGGYDDRSNPNDDAEWKIGLSAVKYAWSKGTVIDGSAGNEHVRVAKDGRVLSHGSLTIPSGSFADLYGYYENPAGYSPVVNVSSTGNVVVAPSATCPQAILDWGSFTWCKPRSDAHQARGIGQKNQLTYYSSYGPGIDVAGPGGARKFNVPAADRGGTPGWPYTGANSLIAAITGGGSSDDGYNAWEDFSTTSNYAVQVAPFSAFTIPCFTFTGFPGIPDGQCYAIIQGTSMAAPHAGGVMALIASRYPDARKNPARIIQLLKDGATKGLRNQTGDLDATDTSPGDLTGLPCPSGYCHLSSHPVPSSEVYGAGLVSAEGSLTSPR